MGEWARIGRSFHRSPANGPFIPLLALLALTLLPSNRIASPHDAVFIGWLDGFWHNCLHHDYSVAHSTVVRTLMVTHNGRGEHLWLTSVNCHWWEDIRWETFPSIILIPCCFIPYCSSYGLHYLIYTSKWMHRAVVNIHILYVVDLRVGNMAISHKLEYHMWPTMFYASHYDVHMLYFISRQDHKKGEVL